MKQLYPPPDVEPEAQPPDDGSPAVKPAPFGKRRPSHGALFGGPGVAPPKGKVRQLYPPSLDTAGVVEAQIIATPEAPEPPAWTRSGFDADEETTRDGGLFVSGEQELEERRRRARERAEQRRLDDVHKPEPELNPPYHLGLDDHEE
jgi:hypothetical protein